MQSIQSIATVIQALLNKYEESTAFQPASTKPSDATREQRKPKLVHPSQDPSQAARVPRRPNTHCLRFGTPDHLIHDCSVQVDTVAKDLRDMNREHNGFVPVRRFAEHGSSLAHTLGLRETRWPKN